MWYAGVHVLGVPDNWARVSLKDIITASGTHYTPYPLSIVVLIASSANEFTSHKKIETKNVDVHEKSVRLCALKSISTNESKIRFCL